MRRSPILRTAAHAVPQVQLGTSDCTACDLGYLEDSMYLQPAVKGNETFGHLQHL